MDRKLFIIYIRVWTQMRIKILTLFVWKLCFDNNELFHKKILNNLQTVLEILCAKFVYRR